MRSPGFGCSRSDALGDARATLPIPANPSLAGAVVDAQAIFYWGFACPLSSPVSVSSSNALQWTLQ